MVITSSSHTALILEISSAQTTCKLRSKNYLKINNLKYHIDLTTHLEVNRSLHSCKTSKIHVHQEMYNFGR